MIPRIIAAALLITTAAAQTTNAACDRACLQGFMDQYVAALVARDPSRLPLAKGARYTENGVTLELGDGMWGPVITMGAYKLYFADPKAGQVGCTERWRSTGTPQDRFTSPESAR